MEPTLICPTATGVADRVVAKCQPAVSSQLASARTTPASSRAREAAAGLGRQTDRSRLAPSHGQRAAATGPSSRVILCDGTAESAEHT
jgi:hypothetical protein